MKIRRVTTPDRVEIEHRGTFAYWDGTQIGLRGKRIASAPILSWTWFNCGPEQLDETIEILQQVKELIAAETAVRKASGD